MSPCYCACELSDLWNSHEQVKTVPRRWTPLLCQLQTLSSDECLLREPGLGSSLYSSQDRYLLSWSNFEKCCWTWWIGAWTHLAWYPGLGQLSLWARVPFVHCTWSPHFSCSQILRSVNQGGSVGEAANFVLVSQILIAAATPFCQVNSKSTKSQCPCWACWT